MLTASFLGPVTRLSVRLDGAETVGNGPVRVDLPSYAAEDCRPGARVGLRLEPRNPMVIP